MSRSSCDVLLLLTRMNIGGPAKQVAELAKGLSAELRVRVAAGQPPEHEGEIQDPEVAVEPVPLVRPLRPLTDARGLFAVRNLLGRTAPGVLHTHMAKAGALGRLAASSRRPGPRLVHTFHGHVLEGYFGPAQRTAFLQVERALARRTDVLVTVSPEVRDELLGLGVGKPAQYRVIPLGFDLSRFMSVGGQSGQLRSALGLGADVPLAGVLGRLVPVKDHATLLSALAGIARLHLAVLGDGELRQELEASARRLGVADRVHFTGWWADVPAALADMDMVVLPSRNEGTPVALIEALAAARPVVATAVGGVGQVVQDGETGWLCPPGDTFKLAELMARVLAQPAESRRMAVEGRRRVSQRFGRQRMLDEHRDLYNELLGRPGA
ncbi:MAG: glycosyltransferase [Acidimicrobiales bacterium]